MNFFRLAKVGVLGNIILLVIQTTLISSFKLSYSSLIFQLFIMIIALVLAVLIFLGYIHLSKKTNSFFIKIASYIMLLTSSLYTSAAITSLSGKKETLIIYFICISLYSISSIIFGISLLTIRKKFSPIALSLSILYIISGIYLFVYIPNTLWIIIFSLSISIFELALFSKASKK